jgi:hypothetical protein
VTEPPVKEPVDEGEGRDDPTSATTPPDLNNTVSGRVVFDKEGVLASVEIAGATIAPVETKDDGTFEITKVPPGAYILRATSVGTVRGYYLDPVEMQITVPAGPAKMAPVEVVLH